MSRLAADSGEPDFPRTRFRAQLRKWYTAHGRHLPWRESHNAYRIWLSEIMLQQTTVAAVKPYFERFLARFPDIATLAAADEQDVLRLWEGLGYYSRARNLHKTARVVMQSHGGQFPASLELLQELPGVGRYTAGAIAAFAFDLPAPIVEANTLRLYSRLLAYSDDPRASAGQKVLWKFAENIVPRTEPGPFNQALMDLGALVCTPQNPACLDCPVKTCCRAFAEGRQGEIPNLAPRQALTDVFEATVVVFREGRALVLKRPEGGRWAGLWDFVRFETESAAATGRRTKPADTAHLANSVKQLTGVRAENFSALGVLKHGVTRFRITLACYEARWKEGEPDAATEFAWVQPGELANYPLSVTGRKVAQMVSQITR